MIPWITTWKAGDPWTREGMGSDFDRILPLDFEPVSVVYADRAWASSIGYYGPLSVPDTFTGGDAEIITSGRSYEFQTWLDTSTLQFQVVFFGGDYAARFADASGKGIGLVRIQHLQTDTAFGYVVGAAAVAFAMIAGPSIAAEVTASSGSAAAGSAASTTYSVATGYAQNGAVNVATIAQGVTKMAGSFDSFDYTSGESVTQVTDAQTVDYGFQSMDPATPQIDPGVFNFPTDVDTANAQMPIEQTYNATVESTTSDFGAVNYDFGIKPEDASQVGLNYPRVDTGKVPIEQASQLPSVSGAGFLKYIFQRPPQARPPTVSRTGNQSLASQAEGSVIRKYENQLAANRLASGPNPLVLIGAALIGVALFL